MQHIKQICFVVVAFAALTSAGCTSVPHLPQTGEQASISQIVDRVQCEVYETIQYIYKTGGKKKFEWVEKYVAQASMALTINAEGGVSPSFALLGPFNSGTFAFGASASLTGGANRIATYDFLIPFKKASKYHWCNKPETSRGVAPLAGNLGFGEWFAGVLLSRDRNDPFTRPEKLSHKAEFFLDGNLRVTPAFELTRSRGGGLLAVSRKDTHTLDIVFAYDDPDPDFEKVCVVNFPDARPEDCRKSRFKSGGRVPSDLRLKLERGQQDLQLRGIQQQLQIQRR